MLGRYTIRRGVPVDALPSRVRSGTRVDTRKHTRHCLRPSEAMVAAVLGATPAARPAAFAAFERDYLALLAARHAADPAPFDALRDAAMSGDVFLGCNCPTRAQPEVRRCHTVLALRFLSARYPELDIDAPER